MLKMLQYISRVSLKIIKIIRKEIGVISNQIEAIIQMIARYRMIYRFNLLNHIQYHDSGAACAYSNLGIICL
jgi:hypothetical protein